MSTEKIFHPEAWDIENMGGTVSCSFYLLKILSTCIMVLPNCSSFLLLSEIRLLASQCHLLLNNKRVYTGTHVALREVVAWVCMRTSWLTLRLLVGGCKTSPIWWTSYSKSHTLILVPQFLCLVEWGLGIQCGEVGPVWVDLFSSVPLG